MSKDTLPHSDEAERAVLGGILLDAESIIKIKPMIDVDDFYAAAHQRIYAAMLDVYEGGQSIDLVTLHACIEDKGERDKVGGPSYLSKIQDDTPSAANIESYARIVSEKALSRRIIAEAQKVITAANDPTVKADDIPTRLAIESNHKIEINHVSGITKKLNSNIAAGYPGLYPCYDILARTIRKVSPGHLWIVGAWTSTGKSAFLVDFICRMYRATTQNPGIAIFSTEMSCEQYLIRCLSNETALPPWRITENVLKPEQAKQLIKAQSFYAGRNLYLYDTLYKIGDIERTARMLKEQKGLQIMAIDYLQNLWGEGSIYERMSRLAPILQYLAKDLQVTVIALSQVSNQHARGETGGLINYKGAGEIAASADLGIELQRDTASKEMMKIMVKKNRHGRIGDGVLEYINEFTRLREAPLTDQDGGAEE
jgi:replicative DNA helicase